MKRRPLTGGPLALLVGSLVLWSSNAGAQAPRPDFAAGEYFVGFRTGVTTENIGAVQRMGASVTASFPAVRAVAVRVAGVDVAQAIGRNPRVAYVEPVPMRYALGLDDAQLVPSLSNGLYGLLTTRSTDTHARGFTGSGINVGVADTGLDYTHPDIAPNYRGGVDYISNDNDPWWNNSAGETHGTHVAGTVMAANNSVGVLGVAYSANLYHARVLSSSGGSATNIMNGVRWLVETAGCKVVNLSLGGGFPSTTEQNFYQEMRNKGALIVCAAGNNSGTSISYPAGYASNIAVGAVDVNNVHASFSNTGSGLDVSAPGVAVLSSVPIGKGFEASVETTESFSAIGLEYAGLTSGISMPIIACGLGKVGEFPASVAGNIALIRRGEISFADKVTNAQNAGAAAVIIYNNVVGGFKGTLGSAGSWIPAVSVSDAVGATLLSQAGSVGTVVNKAGSWDHYDGTSMATPHVTGVLALIWSVNPALSNVTVEDCLFTTCKDLGAAGYDTTFGRGLVDAFAGVAKAESLNSPPAAPTNLTATPGSGQVSLSWSAAAGASSYNVKRGDTSGGPYTTIATGVTATSFTNTGLSNGATYYFVVTAVNSVGESGSSNEASATPQAGSSPAPPTGLTARAGNAQVTLSWTGSAGATRYWVKRSTTSGGPYEAVAGVIGTTFTNYSLTNGTTYYYVVTAENAEGESGNSNEASATPQAPPPAGLNVAVWTTDLYGFTKSSFRFGETIYFWIRATDSAGAGVPGAAVSFEVRTANGKRYLGNGTTDASGYVIFYASFRRSDGKGTYTASASASKNGATGTGQTTFTVN